MRFTFAVSACMLATVVLVAVTGCKKSADTISVHGRVTNRGEALSNAGITFFPETGRPVTTAVSEGEYRIELAPGDYTVTLTIGSPLPMGHKEGDPVPPPKVTLPDEYTARAKSTLKATVKAGQSEPIDFELK